MTIPHEPIVTMRGVTVRFASVLANDAVDFDVYAGEIQALVGENGTGKSTLMHALSGSLVPDKGTISVDGREVVFRRPSEALEAGIGMVHQKPYLIDELSVLDNLRIGLRSNTQLRSRVRTICDSHDLDLDLDARAATLTDSGREYVALVGLLLRDARIVILDEPSATFSPEDERRYFSVVRLIAGSGRSVVFITHKMREVSEIAHRVTVMRHGRVVFSSDVGGQSDEEMTRVIFGADTGRRLTVSPTDAKRGTQVLSFNQVCYREGDSETLKDVDLSVKGGEIVCVAGIRDYGPRQLEAVCAGEANPTTGSIVLDGGSYKMLDPSILRRHGVGFVPNDRYDMAISPSSSVWESLIVVRRREFFNRWIMDRGRIGEFAEGLLESAGITGSTHRRVSQLSGGTIQRLILAREIDCTQRVLIVSEPFWGLDVEGRSRVVTRIEELRDRGVGILVFASDIDDVLAIADRVAVFYRGAIVSNTDRASVSRRKIGNLMLGLGETP